MALCFVLFYAYLFAYTSTIECTIECTTSESEWRDLDKLDLFSMDVSRNRLQYTREEPIPR